MIGRKMTDSELVAIINAAREDTVNYSGEFMADQEKWLKGYKRDLYGDEVDGQSQVVTSDIQDVIESDMPSLVRIFLGTNEPLVFKALNKYVTQEERDEIDQKNAYCNYLIRHQDWSFRVLHGWMKEALIQDMAVVKYMMEDTTEPESLIYSGLSDNEIADLLDELNGEDVENIEITSKSINEEDIDTDDFEDIDTERFDIEIQIIRKKREFKVVGVPLESFLITRNSIDKNEADLVGDQMTKTKGQLLAEGYDYELVKSLPRSDGDSAKGRQNSQLEAIRHDQTGGTDYEDSINDWANHEVRLMDIYAKIDFDGDGIAERRHILLAGNRVLVNEPFNHVPYAINSAMLMPHSIVGISRANLVYPTQRVKTVVTRQMLDNIYRVNHPRHVVSNSIELDDMLSHDLDGIVRMTDNSDDVPQNHVMPLVTPYMGTATLEVIQYMDQSRAQATGSLLASQGLDADTLGKETATRFEGINDAAAAKVELIARVFAETGFRELYEGCLWMVAHYQDAEQEIEVLGKQVTFNPAKWKYSHKATASVGIGAGDTESMIANLQALYAVMQQLKAQGSPLVDDQKIYNVLDKIIKATGFGDVAEIINNPNIPEQMLQAQNEQLKALTQQLQLQLQQLKNPLSEAEQIKAQARLIEAQGKQSIEIEKLKEEIRQFNIKAAQENAKIRQSQKEHEDDLDLDLTKLELEHGKDLNGGF